MQSTARKQQFNRHPVPQTHGTLGPGLAAFFVRPERVSQVVRLPVLTGVLGELHAGHRAD